MPVVDEDEDDDDDDRVIMKKMQGKKWMRVGKERRLDE